MVVTACSRILSGAIAAVVDEVDTNDLPDLPDVVKAAVLIEADLLDFPSTILAGSI